MKKEFTKEIIVWAISIVPLIYATLIWEQLPERIPTHWNLYGEVDGYSNKKGGALLLFCFPLLIQVLMKYLPILDPKKENYARFGSSYYKLRLLITLFFSFLGVSVLYITLKNRPELFTDFMGLSISLLFAGIGNYIGTIKPNYFTGIRTPWTLSNEENWIKTHRFTGKIWFWGGVLMVISCLFTASSVQSFILAIGILILVIVPIAYSYYLFWQKSNSDKKH